MSDGRSTFTWILAGAALVAAVILVAVTVFGLGFPTLSVDPTEPREDDLPDVQIEFRPNPNSMTLYFAGGDAIESGRVYVDIVGGKNRTWAGIDLDLDPSDPLDAGERASVTEWSEGQAIRIYYQGNNSSGVIARYDP
ncbi:hypothetical protein [Halobacterium zhouii]|uniref:hypothetical protein n=1 Tax=Halobacterium zhouii TaxID=2902624 RepID=UPI001E30433C|nr:hypothetical protein [Halobacterium zhouii]